MICLWSTITDRDSSNINSIRKGTLYKPSVCFKKLFPACLTSCVHLVEYLEDFIFPVTWLVKYFGCDLDHFTSPYHMASHYTDWWMQGSYT